MEQRELLRKVVEVLEGMGVSYMIVGSYGSIAWGEARFTHDIDIVVSLTLDDVKPLIRAFPMPEYYLSTEAVAEAVRCNGQFNLIHPTSAGKVDFIIAQRNLRGQTQLARRRTVEFEPGLKVSVAAPEDIIISKMEYYKEGGSEKHLRDIAGILRISGEEVDRDYVVQWAEKLDMMDVWRAVLRRMAKGQGGNSSGNG